MNSSSRGLMKTSHMLALNLMDVSVASITLSIYQQWSFECLKIFVGAVNPQKNFEGCFNSPIKKNYGSLLPFTVNTQFNTINS